MDRSLEERLATVTARAKEDYGDAAGVIVTAAALLHREPETKEARDDPPSGREPLSAPQREGPSDPEGRKSASPPDGREAGIEAAEILLNLRLDPQAVAAALVHELHRRTLVTTDQLHERVGEEVAALSEGVLRLDRIRWDRLEDEAAESLRKMFLAMASDLRVVLIALASRLHAVRRLDDMVPDEAHRLANETLEVYAPLANRLGVWQLKWELEDLAFRNLEPVTYREIKRLLAEKRDARTTMVREITEALANALADTGMVAKISGRPKHIYSIYKKMQRKRIGFEQVYDVSATRIIVERIDQCYAVLGVVHGLWTPIDGEFDDYIAKPKENFYRSLHTAVIGPDGKPLEIQIRTIDMHEYNEFGIAAHWRYKEAKKADRRFDEKINWIRQLMEWQRDVVDPHALAHSLKTDVFADQVFVFTPRGDIVDLPIGATPIDFAYRVHTEVGHRCRGAKVNGQIVPLDRPLKTGDRIEIITGRTGGPSRDWLNPHLGQTRTASAKQKIRQYFRQQEREASILAGKEALERELKRLGLEAKRGEEILELYPRYPSLDELYAAIGFGDASSQAIASKVLEVEPREPPRSQGPTAADSRRSASVSVAGIDDVLSQPARCCNPVPGDQVVGFITRGRGVTIHRVDCPNYLNHPDANRWMDLGWGDTSGRTYPVAIQIVASERPGLLRDIADLMANEGTTLTSMSTRATDRGGSAVVDLTLQMRHHTQLVRILGKLERLPDVRSVRRMTG